MPMSGTVLQKWYRSRSRKCDRNIQQENAVEINLGPGKCGVDKSRARKMW